MTATTSATALYQPPPERRWRIAETLMGRLGAWFPDPGARARYARVAVGLPMAAWRESGTDVAFVSLARPTADAAEIHLMAVAPERRRHGIGRTLVQWAEAEARATGAMFLTVKTLGPATPSAAYAETRRFYAAVGFCALDEFQNWGPDNTCLFLAKALGVGRPA